MKKKGRAPPTCTGARRRCKDERTKLAAPLFSLSLLVAASAHAASTPRVVVVYAWGDALASEAADHLAEQLGPLEQHRTSTGALDAKTLLAQARGAWPDSTVVALAPEAGEVLVLRVKDGTQLLRQLPPGSARGAPYAVALAARELLELAAEPTAEASAPRAGASWVHLSLAAEVGVGAQAGREGALLAPEVGLSLVLRAPESAWLAALGLAASSFGARRTQSDTFALDYRRSELEVRARFGREVGPLELLFGLALGLSLTEITADREGTRLADQRRSSPVARAGLTARLPLFGGLSLELGLGVALALSPARFLVEDRVALEEGRVRAEGGVGLGFELGR